MGGVESWGFVSIFVLVYAGICCICLFHVQRDRVEASSTYGWIVREDFQGIPFYYGEESGNMVRIGVIYVFGTGLRGTRGKGKKGAGRGWRWSWVGQEVRQIP